MNRNLRGEDESEPLKAEPPARTSVLAEFLTQAPSQ